MERAGCIVLYKEKVQERPFKQSDKRTLDADVSASTLLYIVPFPLN